MTTCYCYGCHLADCEYHYFRDQIGGVDHLYITTPITTCLEYVAALSIRSGNHPVMVGSFNHNGRTLLHHMLSTSEIKEQTG